MNLLASRVFVPGAAVAAAALFSWLSTGSGTQAVRACLGKPGQVLVPSSRREDGTDSDSGHPFLIDRTEITVGQFGAFVAATGYRTHAERQGWSAVFQLPSNAAASSSDWWIPVRGADWRHPLGLDKLAASPEEPVTQVTYTDALAFAKWKGRDLPTPAEWERAARGGDEDPRYSLKWAYAADGTPRANTWQGLFPYSNTNEDGFTGTAPVGCFAPNHYGLYDMIGNVWELTQRTADATPVLKGGSYLCSFNACANFRPSAAMPQDIEISTPHVGFRTIRRIG